MSLRARLSTYWCAFQEHLFPTIEQDLGPLGERYQSFITVLELVRVEQHLPCCRTLRGRPQQDRAALARAFIAKAVFQIDTTRALRERLANDRALRRLCGWESIRALPSEATFSRAFAEFAEGALPSRLHEALITDTMQEQLVGHVSRDATAIEGREKATPKPQQPAKPKRKRGRPRKGEERPKEPSRLERQQEMTLTEMLDDLPQSCAVGTKRNAKGYQESWIGYKLHIDAADGGIPLSCILTSASVNDSQVAIPLATMTAERVTNLYDLMDAAYDAAEIRAHSESLGHVPIIDVNPRKCHIQAGTEAGGESEAHSWPTVRQGCALPGAVDGGARQRSAEGRVRRPAGTCARPQQGAVPPDVRGTGVDRGPVAALGELKTRLRCGHIPPVPKLFAGR